MAFHLHLHRYHHQQPAVRITAARTPLSEDIRHRQRRYVVTMSIRTLCVVLAIVLWQVDRVAAVVALIAGGLLPYIAVVMANAARESPPPPPEAYLKREHPDDGSAPAGGLTADEAAWEAEWEAERGDGEDRDGRHGDETR